MLEIKINKEEILKVPVTEFIQLVTDAEEKLNELSKEYFANHIWCCGCQDYLSPTEVEAEKRFSLNDDNYIFRCKKCRYVVIPSNSTTISK